MRWITWLGGLALLQAMAGIVGCQQPCYLTLEDHKLYMDQPDALDLPNNPEIVAKPFHETSRTPMSVLDTNREIRYMALSEAVAIALERGTVGNTNIDASGFATGPGASSAGAATSRDAPATFGGAANTNTRVGGSDAVRVLRLDPALAGISVESSLTRFDAVWQASTSWQSTDRPVGTALDAFQAQGALNAIVQTDAAVQSSVLKPLPTGGVAGITFGTTYTLTNLSARVNPSYRPSLQFQFEQPLLQGYGVEMNQIRTAHPGSVLTGGLSGLSPTAEGILVTRIRFDQQRAQFELQMQALVSNVEIAYWDLYYAYWNLYAQEQLLRFRYATLLETEARQKAGAKKGAAGDMALARGDYESARTSRLNALNSVLNSERLLRGMLQMRADDGTRIVPSDQPTVAPFQPNWETAYQEAMTLRPELFQARMEVKAQQLQLVALKNDLLPDLRFTATYDINGIGSRLDGPDQSNAFRSFASNHFNNWAIGLRMSVPIGLRAAYANMRRGELSLARAYETLRDSEFKIERNLALQYQRLINNYELIRTTRAARLAYAEQVRARQTLYEAGFEGATLQFVLQAQQQWADALSQEYSAIRTYNESLVGWEFAKGTTLIRNNVQIAEGPLPSYAQVRAVEHEREKAAALILREHPASPCDIRQAPAPTLDVPPPCAPLPEVLQTTPLLRDAPPVGLLTGPVGGTPVPTGPIGVQDLRPQPERLPEKLPTPPERVPEKVPEQPKEKQPDQPQAKTPTPTTPMPNTLPGYAGTALPPIGGADATGIRGGAEEQETPATALPTRPSGGRRVPRDPRAPTEFGTYRPNEGQP